MCIRLQHYSGPEFLDLIHFFIAPTQCQYNSGKNLTVNLRGAYGKSGPVQLKEN